MGKNRLQVSIGMPVYNGERYLPQALDALLTQTFSDFELIICDNASTDQTEAICHAYAARDHRIRYSRSETNLGAARNYQRAFELSSGRYFKWATHDDLCGPEFLAVCLQVLERDPSVVLAYPRTKLIDENGEATSDYEDPLRVHSSQASARFIELLRNLRLCNCLYGLIPADVLRRTALLGNFDGGDIPLLAELSLYGKFCEIPNFLFFRRFHPACSSRNPDPEYQKEFYDPATKERIVFPQWCRYSAFLRAVLRAPLGLAEKARMGAYLACYGFWQRKELAKDLLIPAKQIARRLSIAGTRGSTRPNFSGGK
jgi:glycosyltransferase involved in cell wall biosynthesis